jgi:glycosyltransferase involved in cell wall biosynthesis
MDHTFAVPVFGKAPHLDALIYSLKEQTPEPSQILIGTSTPSVEISAIAERHGVPLHVNPHRAGIAADWNFALQAAKTDFVTLAHQDDVYASDYVCKLTAALRRHQDALIAFCDYSEHSPSGPRSKNVNLWVKRLLRKQAFGARECLRKPSEKARLLSFGNPICCPSVIFNRSALGEFRFPSGFKTNLDWMAWVELAAQPGGFVYVRDCLMSKGIHENSETTATIANRARQREDRMLFDKLWPQPIAAVLALVYRLGYRANRL